MCESNSRSPGRARNKLLKPSRAGMPGDPGATVVTNARAYYSTRAAAGATGTRHSPLPPWGSATPSGANELHTIRAPRVAETCNRIMMQVCHAVVAAIAFGFARTAPHGYPFALC
jgi:hypothetical protein